MPALTPKRTSMRSRIAIAPVLYGQDVRAVHQSADLARDRRPLPPVRAGGAGAQPPRPVQICPTDPIDAVVERDGRRDLVPMRWGLVPSWWKRPLKDFKIATFNARAETVESRAMFRNPFRQKRCLIPASGYYEWESTPTGKQPYYFTTENGSPLTIAGLWDEWRDVETGEPLQSCTMIITEANDFVRKIHDRMPALLTPYQFDPWLSGSAGLELLTPWTQRSLQMWPVSRRVNSSRAPVDDPTLVDEVHT